jgi:hypothetical protein
MEIRFHATNARWGKHFVCVYIAVLMPETMKLLKIFCYAAQTWNNALKEGRLYCTLLPMCTRGLNIPKEMDREPAWWNYFCFMGPISMLDLTAGKVHST